MCVRWEKELPSFGASLGVIMAQGGLAHDQSVCPVASCPGHGQLSWMLRGFSEKIRSSSECCCTFLKAAVTHGISYVPGLTCQSQLEGLKNSLSGGAGADSGRCHPPTARASRGHVCAIYVANRRLYWGWRLHAIKSPLTEFKLLQRWWGLICIWHVTWQELEMQRTPSARRCWDLRHGLCQMSR